MAVTGIIFDCDGTLLDSMDAWLSTESYLAKRSGITLSEEEAAHLGSLNIPEIGDFFHDRFALGGSASDVVAMIYEVMHENYRTRVKARPGALDFVRKATKQGVVCSVASATPLPLLETALEVSGFTPYLKAIISVDDVGVSKRDPAVYDYARIKMGTEKESTWVFEDAAYALRTVKQAGYPAVGIYDCDIAGTHEQLALADIVIDCFGDLDISSLMIAGHRG